MFDLSIVLPTCNRAKLLQHCIESIVDTTECNYQLIVVDGASNDDTPKVLTAAGDLLGDRLRVIREEQREGFVRAANKGFHAAAAAARNLTWLNDDARPLAGALDLAVEQIDSSPPDVAFLAMFHRWDQPRNIAYELVHQLRFYRLCHVRGTLYANFPMGKLQTYRNLDFFDERYYVCAADPDLSLKAWHAGLRVVPAYGCIIDHDEHNDPRRIQDSARANQDNEKLFAKWDLPPKDPSRNDFDPEHPCTLRGLRQPLATAA